MVNRYLTRARKRWPGAEWIIGTGRYASVAHCRVVTVMMFETPAEASKAKRFIDRLGCGGRCIRHHEVIDMGTGRRVFEDTQAMEPA